MPDFRAGKTYQEMNWRERAEFNRERVIEPKSVAGSIALANATGHLQDALRIFTADTGIPYGDLGTSRALISTLQDVLVQISEHLLQRESRGWRKSAEKRLPLTVDTINQTIATYLSVFPAHEIFSRDYISAHLPILRDVGALFIARHFMGWLRTSGRSDMLQSDLLALLLRAGYEKKLVHTRVEGERYCSPIWYWFNPAVPS